MPRQIVSAILSAGARAARAAPLLLALAMAAAAPAGLAIGGDRGQDCKRSQDCALGAFQSGEIKPLTEVLAAARAALPGEVVKVELERKGGAWIYEIKVLTPAGRRREVKIDAQNLAVIKID